MTRVSPTVVTRSVDNNSVTLGWRIDGDTPAKCVVGAHPNAMTPTVDVYLPQNVYRWTGLASGRLYTFFIACVYPDGDTRWASDVVRTTGVPSPSEQPPQPVQNFRVIANELAGGVGRPQIRLEWSPIDPSASGLTLHRFGPAPGFVSLLAQTGSTAHQSTSFNDTAGLEHNTRYRYEIRTYKGTPENAILADAAVAEVTTLSPPPAPSLPRWRDQTVYGWGIGESIYAPGVASWKNGSAILEVFNGTTIHHDTSELTHRHFNGTWNTLNLGRGAPLFPFPPAVATDGHSRIDVFYQGAGKQLCQRLSANWSGGWLSEVDLGGHTMSTPTAVFRGTNRLDVFYRGQNNQLIQRFEDIGVHAWSGEVDLGGQLAGAPTVASWGPDRLDVFYRSPGNHLIQRYWNGTGWSGEVDLGPITVHPQFNSTQDPVATSWGPNRIDIFYRGPADTLYQRFWNGHWSGEVNLGFGPVKYRPAVTSRGPNLLDVFYYLGPTTGTAHRRYI